MARERKMSSSIHNYCLSGIIMIQALNIYMHIQCDECYNLYSLLQRLQKNAVINNVIAKKTESALWKNSYLSSRLKRKKVFSTRIPISETGSVITLTIVYLQSACRSWIKKKKQNQGLLREVSSRTCIFRSEDRFRNWNHIETEKRMYHNCNITLFLRLTLSKANITTSFFNWNSSLEKRFPIERPASFQSHPSSPGSYMGVKSWEKEA